MKFRIGNHKLRIETGRYDNHFFRKEMCLFDGKRDRLVKFTDCRFALG